MNLSSIGTILIGVLTGIIVGAIFGLCLASITPEYVMTVIQVQGSSFSINYSGPPIVEQGAKQLAVGYGLTHGAGLGFVTGLVMIARNTYVEFRQGGHRTI